MSSNPLEFRDFITKYVGTQGVNIPDTVISLATAKRIAAVMEFIWKTFRLKGHPPLYKGLINALGLEFITNDSKARLEIGYRTFISIDQGATLNERIVISFIYYKKRDRINLSLFL